MLTTSDSWDFDESYWTKVIVKPDWYFEYVNFLSNSRQLLGEDNEQFKEMVRKIRNFFEAALFENKVNLAEKGPDLDKDRLPIDMVVIHHTSAKPGYRLSYMNAVQLLNVYAPYFADPTDERERSLKGQPLWSNHFTFSKDGSWKQVFYLYHWLMRMDGTVERLLKDSQVGWHAGNWEINQRSVAICLDNDYKNKDPSDEVLRKLASHIKSHYPLVKKEKIIGHCEVRKETICPGKSFLSGWKPKLLEYIGSGS